MALDPPTSPARFEPTLERSEQDEAETVADIIATMASISDTTYASSGQALRSVHAKSHGLIKATVTVLPGLQPVLAQGIFSKPRTYEAIIRLSTIPGDILPDSISTPRGFAMKVLSVEGARLDGSDDDACQDFVTVNAPQFQAPSGKAFLSSLKLVAKTTDRVEPLKHVAATLARGAEATLEAVGIESAALRALGGEAENHILGETFFGQLPIKYGPYIAKFSIVPTSPALKALTGAHLETEGEDKLRQAVSDFFANGNAAWDFRVQLCTDLDAMPIEDPLKVWNEEKSGFFTVARIESTSQATWSPGRASVADQALAFSPWRGIEDHRPLGAIMRMRQRAYAAQQAARAERNGIGLLKPRHLADIPD